MFWARTLKSSPALRASRYFGGSVLARMPDQAQTEKHGIAELGAPAMCLTLHRQECLCYWT
jgi:hypothetical protein